MKMPFAMARYLCRDCPRCKGYGGITIRESAQNTPVIAVNGHCNKSYWSA